MVQGFEGTGNFAFMIDNSSTTLTQVLLRQCTAHIVSAKVEPSHVQRSQGCVLAISPWELNQDASLWPGPDPLTFAPERPGMQLLGPGGEPLYVPGVGGGAGLLFGGGRYRCPGRHFAEACPHTYTIAVQMMHLNPCR